MKQQMFKQFVLTLVIVILLAVLGSSTIYAEDAGASITIPSIDVAASIVDAPLANNTWDVSHLRMTVGRLQGMPWFGSQTNVVLAGHSLDTEGNPDIFYNLSAVNIGDDIFVNVGGTTYHYRVTAQFNVSRTDLHILYPTPHSQLTLFTCDTGSYSNGRYERRVVVQAAQVG